MKRIVIVRHAKAVPYGYHEDFSRDLRESGVADAKRVSSELKKLNVVPGKMISSPAKRAWHTASIFADTYNYSKENIVPVEDIYEGMTTGEFLEYVKKQPDELDTIFFFGHNPDFYHLVNNLLAKPVSEMPTCSTVCVEFEAGSWMGIEARTGRKLIHLVPRDYR